MNDSALWQFSLGALHAAMWGGSLLAVLFVCLRYLSARTLVVTTLVTLLGLVMLGAYVRLSDAGLGCPDWPGCYGKLSPTQAADRIEAAARAAPQGPVSLPKAWREMVHRYFASLVGLMILAIAIKALVKRRRDSLRQERSPEVVGLPLLILFVVLLQGFFGKWTVTFLLKPGIVTLHLLGGMTLVALVAWLSARHLRLAPASASRGIRTLAAVGLLVLVLQIALGGWVSSNYAALACVDFPTCHGTWKPDVDFVHGFHFVRDLGMTAEGEPLSNEALNAIQWTHRLGALLSFLVLGYLAYRAMRDEKLRRLGSIVLGLLLLQVTLGITNVVASLPLPVAVAHNGGAALLLAALVMLNFAARPPSPSRQ